MTGILLVSIGLLLMASVCRAVINTGLVEKGLKSDFFARYGANKDQAYWPELTTKYNSTTQTEKHRWLGTVPQLRVWVDVRLAKGLHSESYDVDNLKYEATIEVDRDEIDDDQTGQIRIRVGELAQRAADYPDYLIEELLKAGGTSGHLSYDGVTFFNAAHVSGESGPQSNDLTYAADDGTTPTVSEFRGAVAQAIAKMVAYKDDQGQPLRIKPNPSGFVTVVPPSLMFTAMEALGLALAPTATNPFQGNILQNVGRVFPMPGLTDGAVFYLCKTDVAVRPFIYQDRMPIEFGSLEEKSESGFIRERFLYGVRTRFRICYGYWQHCIRTSFT